VSTPSRASLIVLLGSAALAVIGIAVLLAQPPVAFGWFAYSSGAEAPVTTAPVGAFLSPGAVAGLVLLVVGIAAATFAAGWMLGRRRTIGLDAERA
jgi:hypothetical protein